MCNTLDLQGFNFTDLITIWLIYNYSHKMQQCKALKQSSSLILTRCAYTYMKTLLHTSNWKFKWKKYFSLEVLTSLILLYVSKRWLCLLTSHIWYFAMQWAIVKQLQLTFEVTTAYIHASTLLYYTQSLWFVDTVLQTIHLSHSDFSCFSMKSYTSIRFIQRFETQVATLSKNYCYQKKSISFI